jgi:hypothetical protein
MMQSARLLEISIILATHPLDRVQYEARNTSDGLFVNIDMMEDTGKGLDWLRANEQFSHAFAVVRYFIF